MSINCSYVLIKLWDFAFEVLDKLKYFLIIVLNLEMVSTVAWKLIVLLFLMYLFHSYFSLNDNTSSYGCWLIIWTVHIVLYHYRLIYAYSHSFTMFANILMIYILYNNNFTDILYTLMPKDDLGAMVNNLRDVPYVTKIMRTKIKAMQVHTHFGWPSSLNLMN